MHLAIIGSSGRNPIEKLKLNAESMEWMKSNIYVYIDQIMESDPSKITLVSGGSSWADHVAVQLFLSGEFNALELYLPAEFDLVNKCYVNTTEGSRLNYLHTTLTLKELSEAISNERTTTIVKTGFHQRNTLIAINCDHLLAFTFGDGDRPQIGTGTMDTWNKCKHENKFHVSLQNT